MTLTNGWLVGICILIGASSAEAAASAEACQAAKTKATGKRAAAELACHAKATAAGEAVDGECLAKADAKFDEAMTKIAAKYPCPAVGDPAGLETSVAEFVADVLLQLPVSYKRVFISSGTQDGAMAGFYGADQLCQNGANTAGLGGTWAAWLSASDVDASVRIPDAQYRLVDLDTVVATSKADLLDGELRNPIHKDENGNVLTGLVWTGTLADGTKDGTTKCSNWTWNMSGSSTTGASGGTTNWTNTGVPTSCNAFAHLYCFEQ